MRQNTNQSPNTQNTPHTSHKRASYEVSFVRILEKIDCIIKAPHCTCIIIYLLWVTSRICGCLVTWFCYQVIAKPGNKTATVSWSDQADPYQFYVFLALTHRYMVLCKNFILAQCSLSINTTVTPHAYKHTEGQIRNKTHLYHIVWLSV